MKIIVLGSSGMLGQSLMKEGKKRLGEIIGLSKNNSIIHVDITDYYSLRKKLTYYKPGIIINSAGLVDIDQCEKDPCLAYQVNSRAISYISDIARDIKAYFIHISTDHYYYCEGRKKHKETDKIILLNEYSRTKYCGERLALLNDNALVIRTNIVGFRRRLGKPTFLEWLIKTFNGNERLLLYYDYFTSSIHTRQLSSIIFDLIDKHPTGLLNIACREVYSKKEFIRKLAKKIKSKLLNCKDESILNHKGVIRANSLGLDVTNAECLLGYKLPSLDEVIESIGTEYEKIKVP